MPDIKTALSAALLRAPAHAVVQTTINQWDDEGAGTPVVATKTKGTFMPSEKSARKRGGVIKNNIMRETFDFIVRNPGLSTKSIAQQMEYLGFKPNSVTSVVSQLCRSNQIIKEGIGYRTNTSAYAPMGATPSAKVSRLKKQVEALKEVAKSRGIKDLPIVPATPVMRFVAPAAGIAALDVPAKSKFIIRQTNFNAKEHIDKLSVYQAREVYAELKTMFGA